MTRVEQVISWGDGGVRAAGQHQAGAVASSRGEVTHPGLPRQEKNRLGGIIKLRFWGSREVGEKISVIRVEPVIAWCFVGVRTAEQHQAEAVASSRGEVTHPGGRPRQEQSRLEGINKLRFWGKRGW
jgi:hypothetical protein